MKLKFFVVTSDKWVILQILKPTEGISENERSLRHLQKKVPWYLLPQSDSIISKRWEDTEMKNVELLLQVLQSAKN